MCELNVCHLDMLKYWCVFITCSYMFLVRGRMKKHPQREKMVAASHQKEYWAGEVEIVSKPIYIIHFL